MAACRPTAWAESATPAHERRLRVELPHALAQRREQLARERHASSRDTTIAKSEPLRRPEQRLIRRRQPHAQRLASSRSIWSTAAWPQRRFKPVEIAHAQQQQALSIAGRRIEALLRLEHEAGAG